MALPLAERLERDCEHRNSLSGSLTGYDCALCLNRGLIYFVRNNEIIARECACKEIRASLQRTKNSGLSDKLDLCTFESYQVSEVWQQIIKQQAAEYTHQADAGQWLYIGGQVGSGKTHLCTAVVGALLKSGKSVRYMLWRDEVVQLKASVNDDAIYSKLMKPLKSVDVLYIDDFFKTAGGRRPTDADINIAFELINSRYNNRSLVTIFSSEWSIGNIIGFDEAVGSRIFERARQYCLFIERKEQYNWRLRQ